LYPSILFLFVVFRHCFIKVSFNNFSFFIFSQVYGNDKLHFFIFKGIFDNADKLLLLLTIFYLFFLNKTSLRNGFFFFFFYLFAKSKAQ
jgi:hypothetical protein